MFTSKSNPILAEYRDGIAAEEYTGFDRRIRCWIESFAPGDYWDYNGFLPEHIDHARRVLTRLRAFSDRRLSAEPFISEPDVEGGSDHG